MIRSNDISHANIHHAGLTLIEVVVSIVLVSTIMLVSLTASANLMRNQAESRNTNNARQLGTQILDEITALDFRDRVDPTFGIESGESTGNRTTMDDVDDYHGYSESTPTHRDGTAIDEFDGWSYSVQIVPANADTNGVTTTGATTDSLLRLVIVSCTSPDGTTTDSAALVADCKTDSDETDSYERWRRIKLDFTDREVNITTPLRNHPEPVY